MQKAVSEALHQIDPISQDTSLEAALVGGETTYQTKGWTGKLRVEAHVVPQDFWMPLH